MSSSSSSSSGSDESSDNFEETIIPQPAQPATLAQLMQGLEDEDEAENDIYGLNTQTQPQTPQTPSVGLGGTPGGGPPSSSAGTPDLNEPLSDDDDDAIMAMAGSDSEDQGDDDESGTELGEEAGIDALKHASRTRRGRKTKKVDADRDVVMGGGEGSSSGVNGDEAGAKPFVAESGSVSARRIRELNKIEAQISRLLLHASGTIAALSPPSIDDANPEGSDTSPNVDAFSTSLNSYYSTLDDIHIGIRTSLAHLSAARIPPRLLFQPAFPHPSTGNPAVGIGGVGSENRADDDDGLSLGALALEKDAWKDLLVGLEGMKEPRGMGDGMEVGA